MKAINYFMLRSVFALVLGLLLVLCPEEAINYLVITVGVLFFVPGLISLISYFARGKKDEEDYRIFPIAGVGSILFGLWLMIMPAFFVNILMYILGALLVIAGVQQIAMLVSARKWSMVPFGFYVMPALILLTGIMIIAYPFGAAANTFVIFGVASIFYGIIELINWYKFRQR